MRMVDDFEDDDVNVQTPKSDFDDESMSERKVIALMQQMAQQINQGDVKSIEKLQNQNASLMSIKPEANCNYWDVTGLPTGCRLYPDGTAIKARPLKVLDIKKLTSLNEYNADAVINEILRNCIRGISIDELYLSDKLYLIFWLRANSYRDNNYVVDFECPKCAKESTYHFEINSINIDKLKDDFSENTILRLSSGSEITLGYLKVKDEVGMTSFREKYSSILANSGDEVDDELLAVSFMIKTIDGKHLDPLNKYHYILGLDPQDYSILTTYIENNIVGVKPYMNVTCDKCGGESQIGISFRPDFFLPKHRA